MSAPFPASDLYEALHAALKAVPNYHRAYTHLGSVFSLCLLHATDGSHVLLGGKFARLDYLLKEHNAPTSLVRAANDTRVRLRRRSALSDEELKTSFAGDLKNLCRLIAFVSGEEVPETLSRHFSKHTAPAKKAEKLAEYVRAIVEEWDENYVYCRTETDAAAPPLKLCYTTCAAPYAYDWSYLRKMFYRGAQINLIRLQAQTDGTTLAELIIFEPDCLVDVSAVARCFTNYAESPLVALIQKFQPSASSQAILLGNFAGQLLDEALHDVAQSAAYNDEARHFFRQNAVAFLTTPIDNHFHDDAKQQKRNICRALGQSLPATVSHFDLKEGMVEPSFFSEMLGLQGRMDYLQLDFRVVLEQKSGKGGFPYDNFRQPRHREEHYVQLLLYMLIVRYNYAERYRQNHGRLYAFLLYSKYEQSLLGLGFAPELTYRALKVRNGLARAEMYYARENGLQHLSSLRPDDVNLKGTNNPLWQRYQRDQIAAVLDPIHRADELERAYFLRFISFIAREQMLSKLGNETKENSGFAAKWYDTLEEKHQAGNICDRMVLLSPDASHSGAVEKVRLQLSPADDAGLSNFRTGDIVVLYAYDARREPDLRRTMVFRATISRLTAEEMELRLRAAQSDARAFLHENGEGRFWAVEHDFMESSYAALYRGMHAFLSAPAARRDLLLFRRQPEVDNERRLRGHYGAFDDLSLRVKRAKDVFLIIGPPGTGKTSFGLLNTLREELLEPGSNVLVLSYTNRAVDEACSKLRAEGIDFVRVGGELSCAAVYRENLLSERVKNCDNIPQLRQALQGVRVWAGTTTAWNTHLALFTLKHFSLAIIDEASQILEPHLIGLLSAHDGDEPCIRKFVLIGDHKQLPAVVQQRPETSVVKERNLNDILLFDCRLSLFERLLRKYGSDPSVTYMLCKQGRMHPHIAHFPNLAFYGGKLTEVPLPHQTVSLPPITEKHHTLTDILRTRRIAFFAVDRPGDSASDKVNPAEAELTAQIVKAVYDLEPEFRSDETVGVIVPYRNQISTIRTALDAYGIPALSEITIDTVERFQGSQRRYIVYGFTIQKAYQLSFLTDNVFTDTDGTVVDRKLNVAMTRAEEHLFLLGNPTLLRRDPIFARLLQFVAQHRGSFQFVNGIFQEQFAAEQPPSAQ